MAGNAKNKGRRKSGLRGKEAPNVGSWIFEIELKIKLIFSSQTLLKIAEEKEIVLIKKDQEFKFKKEKYVGIIDDALFPFSNVKYTYEKGFYKKDTEFGLESQSVYNGMDESTGTRSIKDDRS